MGKNSGLQPIPRTSRNRRSSLHLLVKRPLVVYVQYWWRLSTIFSIHSPICSTLISCAVIPINSGRPTCGRTSRGNTGERSHKISPPSFCGACLHFSSKKDSAVPFPRRPLSRILCTHELIVLHSSLSILLWGGGRKYPSSCDCTEIRTHIPTSDGFKVTNCTTGATGTTLNYNSTIKLPLQ